MTPRPVTERPERVFVTVSRQPGAGAISFSHRLAERLNQDGQGDWSAWDRELVEKGLGGAWAWQRKSSK